MKKAIIVSRHFNTIHKGQINYFNSTNSSFLNNHKVSITPHYSQEFVTIGKTQNSKLVTSNSLNGGNDLQFKKTLEHFNLGNLEQYRNK